MSVTNPMDPAHPLRDPERIAAVESYQALDTPPESENHV